uniref:Uncharacterized protein n=1 Tax=Romanomermis culicivorax TaxID=13658 RepID=A0A915JZC1_ROMCU
MASGCGHAVSIVGGCASGSRHKCKSQMRITGIADSSPDSGSRTSAMVLGAEATRTLDSVIFATLCKSVLGPPTRRFSEALCVKLNVSSHLTFQNLLRIP